MAIVTAALWLALSTASPPDPTLVAPPIDPPAPVVVEDATASIAITEKSLWTSLEGDAVSLVLRDGSEAHGTVIAQTTHAIRLARARDGLVVLLIKSDITSVRVHPRPEPEPTPPPNKARQRLIGGGAFLLTFGGAATLSGATMLAVYPEYATRAAFSHSSSPVSDETWLGPWLSAYQPWSPKPSVSIASVFL